MDFISFFSSTLNCLHIRQVRTMNDARSPNHTTRTKILYITPLRALTSSTSYILVHLPSYSCSLALIMNITSWLTTSKITQTTPEPLYNHWIALL